MIEYDDGVNPKHPDKPDYATRRGRAFGFYATIRGGEYRLPVGYMRISEVPALEKLLELAEHGTKPRVVFYTHVCVNCKLVYKNRSCAADGLCGLCRVFYDVCVENGRQVVRPQARYLGSLWYDTHQVIMKHFKKGNP